MPPLVATIVYILLILGLFWLDRDRKVRSSKTLWIPVMWLVIAASRPISLWLPPSPIVDTPEQYLLEANPANNVVLSVLLAGGLIALVFRSRQVLQLLRSNGLIVLFFLYCGVSVAWSDFPDVAFRHWFKSLGDLVMLLVVLTETDLAAAMTKIVTRPAFILVPVSVLLIKYYPNLGLSYNPWTFVPQYSGVATSKNMLGVLCLIFGLGSLWRFLTFRREPKGTERRRHLIAHAVVLVMTFWLFWKADSMTSLVCFVLAAGLMVVTSHLQSARRPAVLGLLFLAALCTPLMAVFSNMGGDMVASLGRDPTLTGRTNIWKVVLSVSGSPWVGTGFESFWLGRQRLQTIWQKTMLGLQEAHNGYLEVFLNLGWMGVILLAGLIWRGYRNVAAALRVDASLGGLKLAFLFATLVYSLTEAGFRMMSLSWLAFLLATVATPPAVLQEGVAGTETFHNLPASATPLAQG